MSKFPSIVSWELFPCDTPPSGPTGSFVTRTVCLPEIVTDEFWGEEIVLAVESSTSVTFEETSPKSAENAELENAKTLATIHEW